MKERPVIFNGEMVKAIIRGDKTQTRRIMKPQPIDDNLISVRFMDNSINGFGYKEDGFLKSYICPYGDINDTLWVRETFSEYTDMGFCKPLYKADNDSYKNIKWTPSIFMPKEYARIWLTIKDIRIEKINQIAEADAKAEGVNSKAEFIILWDKINKKRGYGWDKNPWVWVIEFEIKDIYTGGLSR